MPFELNFTLLLFGGLFALRLIWNAAEEWRTRQRQAPPCTPLRVIHTPQHKYAEGH